MKRGIRNEIPVHLQERMNKGKINPQRRRQGNSSETAWALEIFCFVLIHFFLSWKLRLRLNSQLGVQNLNHLPGWRTPKLRKYHKNQSCLVLPLTHLGHADLKCSEKTLVPQASLDPIEEIIPTKSALTMKTT